MFCAEFLKSSGKAECGAVVPAAQWSGRRAGRRKAASQRQDLQPRLPAEAAAARAALGALIVCPAIELEHREACVRRSVAKSNFRSEGLLPTGRVAPSCPFHLAPSASGFATKHFGVRPHWVKHERPLVPVPYSILSRLHVPVAICIFSPDGYDAIECSPSLSTSGRTRAVRRSSRQMRLPGLLTLQRDSVLNAPLLEADAAAAAALFTARFQFANSSACAIRLRRVFRFPFPLHSSVSAASAHSCGLFPRARPASDLS